MEENFKSGFATLIGRPNVGKSTLMNCLIGQKIAITSNKPQTTRNRIQTVFTCEKGQIVFLDTPGLHKAKNKLGDYMVKAAERTFDEVDVILWLVEAEPYIGGGDRQIAARFEEINVPVVLVINKIDKIKKEEQLPVIDAFQKLYEFADIVPVCAKTGENTDILIDVIFQHLKEGPMFYEEDVVTDQPMRQIAAEIIREKALHCLSEEVPHGIAVTIETMKERKGKALTDIEATIICEKASHKGIIIGKNGAMLKKIGSTARFELEKMLERKVNLKLWVKVRKEWRDSDLMLKNFGYDKRDL